MKVKSLKTGKIYDLEIGRSGENRQPCPECSHDRKKKTAKSFSFNAAKGIGKCFNCDGKFVEFHEQKIKQYVVPEWKNRTELSDKAAKWMRSRMITDETINSMNVSSGVEFMPQTGKDESVICFPYYRNGRLVNVKFRDARKNFKLVKDAELILYNIDGIRNEKTVIITEGEIDALSFIQVGIKSVVSVPNGAGSNLEYIDNCYEDLDHVEKFYLATDNDQPGYKLREELIRRLGAERCAVINFGDCKDANEYLQKYGGYDLAGLLAMAQDVPIEGVVYCSDIYDDILNLYKNGMQPGEKLGISDMDNFISWVSGRLCTVTGIPGHGKSEFVDWIVTLLNVIHGWKAAYFSPENHPLSYHYSKLASKITGKGFNEKDLNSTEFSESFQFINQNYFFINPTDDLTIESILERAKYLVRKFGIRTLVIDPYNRLEHYLDGGESETTYISRFLDKITNFARVNGVLVFLVAHPKKMMKKKDSQQFEVPNLYDINGSANFFNKTDYGITVYRDREKELISILIQKVKFKHWGSVGGVNMNYNNANGRFYIVGENPNWDNWLNCGVKPQVKEIVQDFYSDEKLPF